MSNWDVHLEFEEGTSSKFWRARLEGRTLYINYGRIGSAGQTQPKDFPSPDLAQRELDKLVAEKRKKGYVDAGAGGGGGGVDDDDDDVNDDVEDDDVDEDDITVTQRRVRPGVAAAPAPAPARPAGGVRMLLETGNRKVEAHIYLDGKTVRMDSIEHYANPESAKKAHERLKKLLAAEGYKES
ncbi:MAG TPA: WGR domain-containing protein [Kofleriaceae bacterium]